MWIIILIFIILVFLPKFEKGDPNCKICNGKGEHHWYGFDGMGDYWYNCKCKK